MIVAVPLYLYDEIYRRVDAAIVDCPGAAEHRDFFYQELLEYFGEHGRLPDFTIAKKE